MRKSSRIIMLAIVVILAMNLSGCANLGKTGQTQTRCPACGYEFQVPETQ